MPKSAFAILASAVLACSLHTPASGDRRELPEEIPISLDLVEGRGVPCRVRAWSEVGVEGSCGSYRWEDLKPAGAFAALKAMVPAKDASAAEDAVAVVWSLAPSEQLGRVVSDWARRAGVEASAI